MKKILSFLVLIMIFSACKKNSNSGSSETAESIARKLVGTWEAQVATDRTYDKNNKLGSEEVMTNHHYWVNTQVGNSAKGTLTWYSNSLTNPTSKIDRDYTVEIRNNRIQMVQVGDDFGPEVITRLVAFSNDNSFTVTVTNYYGTVSNNNGRVERTTTFTKIN